MKDELLAEYAAKLQEIYDNRTAGDYTFAGVLGEFSKAIADEYVYVRMDMHADSWAGPAPTPLSYHRTLAGAIAAIPENIRTAYGAYPAHGDYVVSFAYEAVKKVRLEA